QVHAAAKVRRLRRLVVPAHVVRVLLELGMDDRAVKTFGVVLHDELPVGLDGVDTPLDELEILHSPRAELRPQTREMLLEREGALGKVDEDVTVPEVRGDPLERVILDSEAIDLIHVGSADEASIQCVGPGVVRALDPPRKLPLRLLAKERSP